MDALKCGDVQENVTQIVVYESHRAGAAGCDILASKDTTSVN